MQVLGWRPVAGSSPAARRGARWRAGLTPRPDLQHALMPARDKPIKFHLTVITVSTANRNPGEAGMSAHGPTRTSSVQSQCPLSAPSRKSAAPGMMEATARQETIASGMSTTDRIGEIVLVVWVLAFWPERWTHILSRLRKPR